MTRKKYKTNYKSGAVFVIENQDPDGTEDAVIQALS